MADADTTIKQGDTWPPLRGKAEDEDGLIDLTTAELVKIHLKSGATLVQGTVEVIDPPDADGFNWQYTWGTADTSVTGVYNVELEIKWDSSPLKIETIPNSGVQTLEIEDDIA